MKIVNNLHDRVAEMLMFAHRFRFDEELNKMGACLDCGRTPTGENFRCIVPKDEILGGFFAKKEG